MYYTDIVRRRYTLYRAIQDLRTSLALLNMFPLFHIPVVVIKFVYFFCFPEDGRKLKGAIQRSTETGLAVEMPSRTVRQASHESIEDSMNSYGSEGK